MHSTYAWRTSSAMGLAAALAMGCALPVETGEIEQLEAPMVRDPAETHVTDELGPDGGALLAPEGAFDSRRDAWEDEWPTVGEDPTLWAPDNQQTIDIHGTRKQRKYGFQWLRSMARNSSVAFFHKNDFDPAEGGQMLRLRMRAWDDTTAERALRVTGFDICPEQRFADQLIGGRVARATCSGVLIDRNLILTAAHCIRELDQDNELKLKIPIEDVRVAFNYVASTRDLSGEGADAYVFDPTRDVFRVREILTGNPKFPDFAILQLLDLDGFPIEAVDPIYQPVPLWEAEWENYEEAKQPYKTEPYIYRAGAAIGVGANLPQKISISRSWGWETDPLFLGINIDTEIFNGNSGGGMYDVETGALVAISHSQQEFGFTGWCPADLSDTWPLCGHHWDGITPTGDYVPANFPSWFVPAWTIELGILKWRQCNKWVSVDWSKGNELQCAVPRCSGASVPS